MISAISLTECPRCSGYVAVPHGEVVCLMCGWEGDVRPPPVEVKPPPTPSTRVTKHEVVYDRVAGIRLWTGVLHGGRYAKAPATCIWPMRFEGISSADEVVGECGRPNHNRGYCLIHGRDYKAYFGDLPAGWNVHRLRRYMGRVLVEYEEWHRRDGHGYMVEVVGVYAAAEILDYVRQTKPDTMKPFAAMLRDDTGAIRAKRIYQRSALAAKLDFSVNAYVKAWRANYRHEYNADPPEAIYSRLKFRDYSFDGTRRE